LQQSLELSSMGIRVDKEVLLHQLTITGLAERKGLLFHKKLLRDEFTIVNWRRDRAIAPVYVFIAQGSYR